jgi:glycosyltransferase involved in cell wall biosynthesis
VADGVTGYLVPPRDSRAIADKVIKLLGDPALRMQMGSAGRAHVLANFTAQRYAAGIGKVIDQALTSTPILASSD